MKLSFLAFCFLVLIFLQESKCSTKQQMLSELHIKLKEIAASGPTNPTLAASNTTQEGRVFYPIGYGADPTGTQDSTDAILKAVGDAFQVQNKLQLLPGVKDLGGVVIDLQGGNYKISQPIRLPASGGGNVVIQGGTLRASDTFPGNRHLIEIWSPNSSEKPMKENVRIYYEDITFRDILFDSSYRGGGIFIIDSARIRIHNCFFLHFTTQGILVKNGHETFISSCFLGQHPTVGGDKDERTFSGTAIDLASNDNAVTDVVIFSAAVGVLLRGQANIITGVHCYNKAAVFGGVGILVKIGGSLTRIDNCYLDFNGVAIEDPDQVHVTDGFFLGGGNVVLKSVHGVISGLNIVDCMFNGNPEKMIPIVDLDGKFSKIDQVVIDRNNAKGMKLKSTVGKLTVAGNGTKWVADFSSVLVFPNRIIHFQYSFYSSELGFVGHAVTNVTNNAVVVESEKAVDAVVSVGADQYNMVGEISFQM